MVKGYDPTTTDPSKILLQYLLRWSTTPNPISIQTAQKYTKYWLKHSPTTSKIYQQFNNFKQSLKPQIKLRKKCSKYFGWSYWKVLLGKENLVDQNYPSYPQNNNQIIICLNFINNKTELKENIDRELAIMLRNNTMFKQQQQEQQKLHLNSNNNSNAKANNSMSNYKPLQSNITKTTKDTISNQSIPNPIQQADKQLMQSLYEGCKQGYKNYQLDKQIEQRISKKCAKYLFFRRSKRQLPLDAKFRYASKVVEEII